MLGRLAMMVLALGWLHAAPARAADGFALNDGVRIAYEVEGSGDPIVLVPGFSQSARAWRDAGFVDALVEAGRQVILVDPRGHGASDKPHDAAAYGAAAIAGDVVAVLDALEFEHADLMGYSRGGVIAIETAIHFPERCRSILVGGAHPYAQDLAPIRRLVADGAEPWVALIEATAGPLPEAMRARILANDVAALQAAVARDLPDRSAALARSGVPAFFWVGEDDPAKNHVARYAAATGAPLLVLPGDDHFRAFFRVQPVVDAISSVIPAQ